MESLNLKKRRSDSKSQSSARMEEYKYTLKLLIKNKLAFVGLVIVLVYFAITILDLVYPQYLGVSQISSLLQFSKNFINGISTPVAPTLSRGWWDYLGTTTNGISILPAMLAALAIDIPISFEVVIIGALIGVTVGTISGYLGGYLDEIVMRITDVFFSVPFLIMAIAFFIVLSPYLPGLEPFILALIIIWWPTYARVARGLALTIKSQKFIEAAVASGSSKLRNVFVHVVPNVLSPVFVQISLDLGTIIQIFATLFFLHFGENNPYLPELGNLLNMGLSYFQFDWWTLVIPGVFVIIFTIAVNLMGDGLRDVLDPRVRR